jgi:hypothetical protein
MIRLLSSFLTGRSLHVEDEGVESRRVWLAAGTPQGSCLSLILYLIFVNDVPFHNTNVLSPSQFADDTGLWMGAFSPQQACTQMQTALCSIESWCCRWRVKLSPAKTQVILFTRCPTHKIVPINLHLFRTALKTTEEVVFLGLTLTSSLTWKTQFENMEQKAWPRVNALRRIAALLKGRHSEILLGLYSAFVRPLFEYAAIAYISASQTHWNRLHRIQSVTIKSFLRLPNYLSR